MKLFQTSFVSEKNAISIPFEVKDWMFGYDAVVVQSTDTYSTNADLFEYLAFKNNVKPTVNTSILYSVDDSAFETGRIIPSVYFQTDRWYIGGDVNNINNYPIIPDYFETAWTAAGVAAFSGAVLGVAKAERFPNHGTELYNISGGIYGWDNDLEFNNGSNNNLELTQLISYSKTKAGLYSNSEAHAGSLRNSRAEGIVGLQQKFIAMRGGGLDAPNRGYMTSPAGRSFESGDLLGQPQHDIDRQWYQAAHNTTRFNDALTIHSITKEDYKTILDGYIETSLKVYNGVYSDFTHWHSCPIDVAKYYYDMIGAWDEPSFRVWYGTWEEVAGYMYFRDGLQSINTYSNGSTVIIEATKIDKYNTVPFPNEQINSFLSVEVDLTGTRLAGEEITSDNGKVISLGSNKYIVQIPFGVGMNTVTEVVLSISSVGYLDLDKPDFTVTDLGASGTQINSDKPVKLALFIETGSTYYCDFRSNTLQSTHVIPKAEVDKGVGHVGIVTEEGQSIIKPL